MLFGGAIFRRGNDRFKPWLARAAFSKRTEAIAARINKQLRMPPHISTSKWSSRFALSRRDNVLDHPKRDPEQPVELSARSEEPMPAAARQSQLRVNGPLRHAPQTSALSITLAAEDQRNSHHSFRIHRLDIVKWFVVVALFASAAFVMIAPFIWL
jgi:hypothetical protein